jgi:hypothetical protein
MADNSYEQILSNLCNTCKECCKEGVPEGVCGYNTIEQILAGKIPENLVKQLVIYRVPREKIDEAAIKWWQFPKTNLLKVLTKEENGFYEFLAVPYAKIKCIFLSDEGPCLYPQAKPFDCSMFPFHFDHEQFKIETWCKMTEPCQTNKEVYKKYYNQTLKSAQQYEKFVKKNTKLYFEKLKEIQKTYKLEIINF